MERLWPLHALRIFRKAFGTDLVYYFLSGLLPKLILIVPITLIATALHRLAPGGFYVWVAAMPLWLRVAAAMVAGEIGAYWGHRWSHETPLLWRFHAIHHSAEEIDWLVNTRAHPVDLVFTRFCGLVPMYVLGLAQPTGNQVDFVPALVTVAGTFWGFFIHANIRWRFGKLEWLLSSPAFHHWHHTNDSPETINKNYSPMLPWVDKVFGTFHLPEEHWPGKYGTDTSTGSNLAEQLLGPITGGAASKPAQVSSIVQDV
jgi:sterol desaturase/sphingolipid hydroxylase (fatty acid hydroxylase superfamily)